MLTSKNNVHVLWKNITPDSCRLWLLRLGTLRTFLDFM